MNTGIQSTLLTAVFITQLPTALAQPLVKLVTVCEVLADLNRFTGKSVGIIGRVDCTNEIVDPHCCLVEDRCQRPFVTNGVMWPNKIWLEWDHDSSGHSPKAPDIDQVELKNKLAVVAKSTALGFHKVMTFKMVNGVKVPSGWRDVPDHWGFAYGKIIKGQPRNFFGAAVGMIVRADDLQENQS
jgi:hypothetical protein